VVPLSLPQRQCGFSATASFFVNGHIASNPNGRFNFSRPYKNAKFPALEAMSMTITEKLQLAGLALGMTASIAWIAFLGFVLSQAVAWLL
jgi:hypothetical protein